MDDLLTSIKAQLYERVASPLTVSFVLAWCGWNYRLIVILLSGMAPPDKFHMIDGALYPDTWTWWLYKILGPLLTSLLYVFVYPFPERWAFKWAKQKQRDLKTIQAALDSDVPLTPEQSRELRLKCKKAVEQTQAIVHEYEERVAQLDQELSALKADIERKHDQIRQLERRAGLIKLTAAGARVLTVLEAGTMLWDDVKVESGLANLLADDSMNELQQLGCVRQFESRNPQNGAMVKAWAITQPGLQALEEHRKRHSADHELPGPSLVGSP